MAPKAEKTPATKGDKAPAKNTLSKDGKKKAKNTKAETNKIYI